ncbi:MAG: branched-chain amino acid ABC transporter permease [Alphaproteobacteria bacterium]|jgi:branched-chain amino acid transport system permease protein|nr:branched-chain amino acid ABC transporter permease [Alphaproteobacteria bacterium]MBT4017086.1 branched-chain amino acid ABC transporter permease [Alphaproteobacteria bacterium]MBT4546064.1 branched-chain amino acid ABC transporter permease [Alphaproteobacteria bacterium]MBT5918330.1 branched-chain amino acid ABC transporter permease [Alphaproteobacteria bacterium]MBT6385511.1 branched-chain amino acid ABC transporter permease [Alphaproteobacteria bacterium]
MDILITGILLGGTYALIAMGLNLQYGVARIMNLANGEMLVAGAFAAFWTYTAGQVSPILAILFVAPLAFLVNWIIYRIILMPLIKRAKNQGQLEVDSILATFGMGFAFVGIMVATFGAEYFSYDYLGDGILIIGSTFALNRIIAFAAAVIICGLLYLWLYWSRPGTAVRAVAVNPQAAGLVGINVLRVSALAFALGGSLTAVGGSLISTFLTLDASIGVLFTMKALIIVIMGGVGDVRGVIVAALILGLAETAVATLIDPGLTLAAAYLIFILVLLFRPQGLFGKPTS